MSKNQIEAIISKLVIIPICWAVRPVHYRTEQLFQFRKSQNYSSKGNRRNRMELECNYWTDPTAVYHMYAKKMA